jgi:hypothetical protein
MWESKFEYFSGYLRTIFSSCTLEFVAHLAKNIALQLSTVEETHRPVSCNLQVDSSAGTVQFCLKTQHEDENHSQWTSKVPHSFVCEIQLHLKVRFCDKYIFNYAVCNDSRSRSFIKS